MNSQARSARALRHSWILVAWVLTGIAATVVFVVLREVFS